MNIRERFRFLRQNMVIYMVGLFLLLGMKYFYSKADCESLLWILGPTARWVEALSGIPFVYEPGMGYANHGLRFLIAPSCSGVQFMIITAALLIFSFSHLVGERPDVRSSEGARKPPRPTGCPDAFRAQAAAVGLGLGWIAVSSLLSYGFTVFINGLRIVAAIYLPYFFERAGALSGPLTPGRLHTMIGVVVYFAALLTIYRLAGLFFRTAPKDRPFLYTVRKCLSPVFWYFLIVLGIPFLNRAYRKNNGDFTEFALLVVLCCGCVLLVYCLGALICRRFHSRLEPPDPGNESRCENRPLL